MGAASAREIAEHYDIPIELLAKILQRLARRGLLTSHQGTRGGYSLARPATVISVADVIQAVDGPLTVTACSVHDQGCGQYSKCNVRDPLWRIKDRILTSLAACSLDEIATDAPMTSAGPELQPVTSRRAARASEPPLLRRPRHDPVRSAGRRGDAAVLHRALRQRVERAASLRLGGARGGRARARPGRRADRRAAARRRLHERRDRVEQPGDRRRGARAPRPRTPRRHASRPSTPRCSTSAPRSKPTGRSR